MSYIVKNIEAIKTGISNNYRSAILWTKRVRPDGWRWSYHSSSLWLITITDGTNIVTMADKNLWASVVYNPWDTVDSTNNGYVYQRWNNYWFPIDWTQITTNYYNTNASWYWPWNYYSSNIFRYPYYNPSNKNWDSSNNTDLWGYDSFSVSWDYADIQWPCDTWFHVPLDTEISLLESLLGTSGFNETLFRKALLMPKNYRIYYNNGFTMGQVPNYFLLWSCVGNVSGYPSDVAGVLDGHNMYSTDYITYSVATKYIGLPIRPFKNTPVTPDSTWDILYER